MNHFSYQRSIRTFILFLLFLASQRLSAQTEITNETGTVSYGGINVTVTKSGNPYYQDADFGCPGVFRMGSVGEVFNYAFSTPVSNVTVGLLFYANGVAQTTQFSINGSPYTVTSANITGNYDQGGCTSQTGLVVASGGNVNNSAGINQNPNGNISISGTINSFSISSLTPASGGYIYQIYFTAAPLPLDLLSFSGTAADNGNQLKWSTTNEVNVEAFIVERSKDGSEFTRIGSVAAKNMDGKHSYDYLDNKLPYNNTLHYRLKMVDIDGKYKYSAITTISGAAAKTPVFMIAPNPLEGHRLNLITSKIVSEGIEFSISDVTGRIRHKESIASSVLYDGKAVINTFNLQKGVYYLQIFNKGTAETTTLKFYK